MFFPSPSAKSPALASGLIIISTADIFTNNFSLIPHSKVGSNYESINTGGEGFRYVTPLKDIRFTVMLLAECDV